MKKLLIALPLFVWAPCRLWAGPADVPDRNEEQEMGAELHHFNRVDEGVYKGSKPQSDADYRYLQSLGVKYIIDLQNLPWTYRFEKKKAQKYGIVLLVGHMNASPISPSEKHVDQILSILRDKRFHPIYFHCKYGRDRTSLVATLYKVYFLGLPPNQAARYLHESGYKDGWVRSGLTRYLAKHQKEPAALLETPEAQIR